MPVPLDHRDPAGRQIELTISRIRTADPAVRRGVLLSNPGGPGGQGLDLPGTLALLFPAEVQQRFDLIGFDPRGVGHSTPITCGIEQAPVELVLPYPDPDGSIERNVAFAEATAKSCDAHSGDLLPYITTANTARDMDLIRQALGEPTISYFGLSYGTYLGAVYTSLFPDRSDRIVLDSAVDPRLVWHRMWRTWNDAVALRFPDFTRWAAARDDVYQLGDTSAEVRSRYFALAGQLDEEPLPLPDVGLLTGNLLREITRSALYFDGYFPLLAELWRDLSTGAADPAAVAQAARATMPWTAGTSAAQVPEDNLYSVLYAITCGDVDWPEDVRRYARNVAVDRLLWPVTNGMPGNLWPCASWLTEPIEPPVRVTADGPRNVLVLQNTRDPATSWRSGFGLRTALGRRAAMVTVDAGNHGTYGFDTCADEVTNRFLVTGRLPRIDRFCQGPSPDDLTPVTVSATPRLRPAGPLGW